MLPRFALRLSAILALLALSACSASGPAVELGGQRFQVEIADDEAERRRGLMFRESLPADAGMLFIFRREEPRSFWMRNCRINLDILYFDDELALINGHYDVPPCNRASCPSYPSDAPARYVLELNGGTAAALGVEPGDRLTLDL